MQKRVPSFPIRVSKTQERLVSVVLGVLADTIFIQRSFVISSLFA